jgi:1-deoxy-D-xylulose-5-phosphate reductoisomerase
MKKVVILGSTGSIGKNTLEVISGHPDQFKVIGLTAGKNITLLSEQIKKFKPDVVAVPEEKEFKKLKEAISGIKKMPEMLFGVEGISKVSSMSGADIVVSAIVGAAGLIPTLSAIIAGKTIALANKETLVMAGDLVVSHTKKSRAKILPVDSEHSAIFQCIEGYKKKDIKKIILTASGGPFVGKKKKDLEKITPEAALKHPNWKMGKKITIDSATLMNKGLEVIEAHYLFGIPVENIDVLIHPQSIIHSMVEFIDGCIIAQMSVPDMKGPIAYALSYPDRFNNVVDVINFEKIVRLTFQKPDHKTFPCLNLAYLAMRIGGTMPAVLNASNEIAVEAFLRGNIGFNEIPVIINKVMEHHSPFKAKDLEKIITVDHWAREKALEFIKKIKR